MWPLLTPAVLIWFCTRTKSKVLNQIISALVARNRISFLSSPSNRSLLTPIPGWSPVCFSFFFALWEELVLQEICCHLFIGCDDSRLCSFTWRRPQTFSECLFFLQSLISSLLSTNRGFSLVSWFLRFIFTAFRFVAAEMSAWRSFSISIMWLLLFSQVSLFCLLQKLCELLANNNSFLENDESQVSFRKS